MLVYAILPIMIVVMIIIKIYFVMYKWKNSKKIIAIEGNIGVGKTTLIEYLKQFDKLNYKSIFVPEPIDTWINLRDDDNNNILGKFYEDKKRWGYSFQNLIYYTRMIITIDALKQTDKSVIFLDRSLGTDKNVFEKMLYDDKYIGKIENNLYDLWDYFYEKYITQTSKKNIIYLRCDPQVAYERIQKRGRDEEMSIDIKYLEKLHRYHENWITKEINNNNNVLVIDCNKDMDKNKICEDIYKFVSKC